MESTRVREMPIGVNASVRYKGCDVEKWMQFGSDVARVRLVCRGSAACVLKNGKITWAKLNELERVSPQEMQRPTPTSAPQPAPSPVRTPQTLQEMRPSSPAQHQSGSNDPAQCTTQERAIDPSHRTTVREMPFTWRGFQPQ